MLSVISNIDYNIFYSLLFYTTIEIDYFFKVFYIYTEYDKIFRTYGDVGYETVRGRGEHFLNGLKRSATKRKIFANL